MLQVEYIKIFIKNKYNLNLKYKKKLTTIIKKCIIGINKFENLRITQNNLIKLRILLG